MTKEYKELIAAARKKDPELLHQAINNILEENPESSINPFTLTDETERTGFDILSILSKPNPTKRRLISPKTDEYDPKYSFECEKILRTRMLLQHFINKGDENILTPILSKLVESNYEFDSLSYKELSTMNNHIKLLMENDCDNSNPQNPLTRITCLFKARDDRLKAKENEFMNSDEELLLLSWHRLCGEEIKESLKETAELYILTHNPSVALTGVYSVEAIVNMCISRTV